MRQVSSACRSQRLMRVLAPRSAVCQAALPLALLRTARPDDRDDCGRPGRQASPPVLRNAKHYCSAWCGRLDADCSRDYELRAWE